MRNWYERQTLVSMEAKRRAKGASGLHERSNLIGKRYGDTQIIFRKAV
jgi:hypothetical protein